jgi:hypothetical protein
MDTRKTIDFHISKEREGSYFTIPFEMPPGTERLSLVYHYEQHHDTRLGDFTSQKKINIIDLGLISPNGRQVGASGSDKTRIEISETFATPGYHTCSLVPGQWGILVGAYKVADEGVEVKYELEFTLKQLRLLKGDLHTHTLASDGVQTAWELALRARSNGLDFLAITDHNQPVSSESLPQVPGMTLIPGIEWTHYKGHATFLGVDQPYDGSFMANTTEEVLARFTSARERGALIALAHPFDEGCPFTFDLQSLPFDMLEIWNGPMRESNLRALGLWQGMLAAGRKIPICGGSDYHRDGLFIFPGGPTTCVYSFSTGHSDILSALHYGHAFLTFAPDGPMLEMKAGDKIMGDSVPFQEVKEIQINMRGLLAGDVVQVVTNAGSKPLLKAETPGSLETVYPMEAPGFAFVMVLRSFVPGLPLLPALVSNPIYFE